MNRLLQLKKNNKGFLSIELAIWLLILVMVACFIVDVLIISVKAATISQASNTVARIAGVQGGVLSAAPAGFPGGEESYTNVAELRAALDRTMRGVGIEDNEWDVLIDGRSIKNSSSGRYNYREEFDTAITVDYTWGYMNNVIPGPGFRGTIHSTRPVVSEWQYDFDEWDGE